MLAAPRPEPGRRLLCTAGAASSCAATTPGHQLSDWCSRLLDRSPWGWRAGVVLDVRGGWIDLECPAVPGLLAPGVVRAWHHEGMAPKIGAAAPVTVHERHHALSGPFGVISILVTHGLGAPPDPMDFETWASGRDAEVAVLR